MSWTTGEHSTQLVYGPVYIYIYNEHFDKDGSIIFIIYFRNFNILKGFCPSLFNMYSSSLEYILQSSSSWIKFWAPKFYWLSQMQITETLLVISLMVKSSSSLWLSKTIVDRSCGIAIEEGNDGYNYTSFSMVVTRMSWNYVCDLYMLQGLLCQSQISSSDRNSNLCVVILFFQLLDATQFRVPTKLEKWWIG